MLAFSILTVLVVAQEVHGLPYSVVQPDLHLAPTLPLNFSTKPSVWQHGTPLLRDEFMFENTQLARRQTAERWSGWQNVHYIFAFGDSYTSTNFTVTGKQPDTYNPLGNPAFPGATSANGPNWIDFLTTTYNESYIQTYNLAYGGAVVDPSLVSSPFGPTVQSFQQQVEDEFLSHYVDNEDAPWTADNSLFTIFIGINDVINSFAEGNDSLNYDIIKSYERLINELYADGARNFLFMNVPPVDRTPMSLLLSSDAQASEASYIGAFNFRLGALVYNLGLRHPDTTRFTFDTNLLFTRVLDNPGQFPEAAGYRNTTNYCTAYMKWVDPSYADVDIWQAELITFSGTPTLTYFHPSCGVPVNEYLWLNDLHPTYPMHNFLASQVARLLGA